MGSEDEEEEEEEEGEEEEKEVIVVKRTTKGKGRKKEKQEKKTKDGWTKVGGEGQCSPCIQENTECIIDLEAIERWQDDFWAGTTFSQHPGR